MPRFPDLAARSTALGGAASYPHTARKEARTLRMASVDGRCLLAKRGLGPKRSPSVVRQPHCRAGDWNPDWLSYEPVHLRCTCGCVLLQPSAPRPARCLLLHAQSLVGQARRFCFHNLCHPGWLHCNRSQPDLPERLTSRALEQEQQPACVSVWRDSSWTSPCDLGRCAPPPAAIRPVAFEQCECACKSVTFCAKTALRNCHAENCRTGGFCRPSRPVSGLETCHRKHLPHQVVSKTHRRAPPPLRRRRTPTPPALLRPGHAGAPGPNPGHAPASCSHLACPLARASACPLPAS